MFVLTARPLALFASAHSVFLNEVIFIALKITKPPLDKVLPELLDRVVKSLDVCNAISLGLDAIKNLQRLAEIAVAALKQTPLGDGQVRPAKKALSSLVAAMLHNDSNAAAKGTERTRSFGRRARTPPPPPLYTNNDYTARQDRRVCENLFSHGPLTLDQLVRYTDLTKDQVRNSLLVLVQHNCAQALVSAPQDDDDDADRLRVRTQYLVLFDNIIHRLRFPKFLEIVLRKLDEEFVKLLVRLLQDGRLTLKQMETTSRKLGAKSVKVNSARIADSIHYGTRIATIKKSLIDPMGNLRNWNSGDLCMANWTGVWRSDREEADGYFHKEKNSIRGDGMGRASLHAPQRRPKYKSGPLGPPGVAYHSMYSLAAPVFEVENGGSFMAGSPFSGDGLTICSGGHGGALSARTKPCMAFLASVHGCSKIQNDKFGGFKDVGTNVSCVVSRRDMATQMSPQGPYSLAEAQNKSKAGKKKKAKSEEAKISAWENLQKAKAEAAIRKLEMKLEKRRASSMDKIMNKRILA
ncbi:putative leucine-rich repeat receptor-like serine/threonine-protein kinase [Glycine soja]